jgi:hypothetical protein
VAEVESDICLDLCVRTNELLLMLNYCDRTALWEDSSCKCSRIAVLINDILNSKIKIVLAWVAILRNCYCEFKNNCTIASWNCLTNTVVECELSCWEVTTNWCIVSC